jgi:hypothetical protein
VLSALITSICGRGTMMSRACMPLTCMAPSMIDSASASMMSFSIGQLQNLAQIVAAARLGGKGLGDSPEQGALFAVAVVAHAGAETSAG